MAATTWRVNAIDTYAGGDLELSALHLYDETGRVDAAATLTCSHVPVSGSLANLQSEDFGVSCRFAAAAVRSPGFYLQWVFSSAVEVKYLRAGRATAADEFMARCTLQRKALGGWDVADLGRFPLPPVGALTDVPKYGPLFNMTPTPWRSIISAETPAVGWFSAALSGNGNTAILGANGGGLQLRRDGGPWQLQASLGTGVWTCAAVSRDGQRLLAARQDGLVFRSSDRGATWGVVATLGSRPWFFAHHVGDGSIGWLTTLAGGVYKTTDFWNTWEAAPLSTTEEWVSIRASEDGVHVVAAAFTSGSIAVSHDSGATFTLRKPPGFIQALSCDISEDGMTIIAGGYLTGGPQISRDGGATWSQTSLATGNWQFVRMSGDASELLAGSLVLDQNVHSSLDGGATWNVVPGLPTAGWSRCGSTRDMRVLLVCTRNSGSQYLYERVSADPTFLPPFIRTTDARPAVMARAPVPAHTTPTLPPADTVRDVEVGGPGTVYGTTRTKGTPNQPAKARVVLLHQRSKLPVRETWSDPVTGYFEFKGIDTNQQFIVLAEDADGNFRPVAANRLTPEVLP